MFSNADNTSGSQSYNMYSKDSLIQLEEEEVPDACGESPEQQLEADFHERREHPKNQGKGTKSRNDDRPGLENTLLERPCKYSACNSQPNHHPRRRRPTPQAELESLPY
ncbi:hypothetical protein PG994_011889 [Apiospora phragmitis]|uniref:Uncharacterized protein n=1 Tax=Apiospora phragmitis TaxID=2905665 RepID=A0ABR1TU33_9PEZI